MLRYDDTTIRITTITIWIDLFPVLFHHGPMAPRLTKADESEEEPWQPLQTGSTAGFEFADFKAWPAWAWPRGLLLA